MPHLTKEDYLNELCDIRDKLTDFLKEIDSGRSTYFKDVSLKLRILFCDKSGTKALFKTVQEMYGFVISVYVKYSMQEKIDKGILPKSLEGNYIFYQTNSVGGWFDPIRANDMLGLMDAINKKDELIINSMPYSYKDIFECMADKMGGAHLDHNISDKVLVPHSKNLVLGGLSSAQRAIYDTSKAAILLIGQIETYIRTGSETVFIKKA